MGAQWFGLHAFNAALEHATERVLVGVAHEAYAAGNDVLRASLRVTPIETGNLRNTGHVSEPDAPPVITVEIGFGGATEESPDGAEYAIPVHERMDVEHAPPTGPKYLENPFNEAAPEIVARLRLAVDRGIGTGVV